MRYYCHPERSEGSSGFAGFFAALRMTIVVMLLLSGCAKPMISGNVRSDREVSQIYTTTTNTAYYAVRDALKELSYTVAAEDLSGGMITTVWLPATADSHYIGLFDRRDYPPNGAYYRLKIHLFPAEGKTRVAIVADTKSIVTNLRSAGIEEQKVLKNVADALRTSEPDISNLGIAE